MYTELELGFTGFLIDFLLAWEAHGGRRLFFSKMDAMERREEGERGERHTHKSKCDPIFIFAKQKCNKKPTATDHRAKKTR